MKDRRVGGMSGMMRFKTTATILFVSTAVAGCTNVARVGESELSGGTFGGDTGGDDTGGTAESTASDDSTGDKLDAGTNSAFDCSTAMAFPSSVGCSFVAGLHRSGGAVLANMGDEVATVTIDDGNGSTDEITIDPGEIESVLFTVPDSGEFSAGVMPGFVRYIESDQPLQAWQFSPATAGTDNDASILLPTHTLGMRHRVASYVSQPFGTPDGMGQAAGGLQTLVVHATEDDTTVQVTFTGAQAKAGPIEVEGPNVIDVEAGRDSAEFVLGRGETLLLHQPWDDLAENPLEHDWTGSLVESSAPVSVFAASITMLPYDFAGVPPESICCQDTIAAAIPPTDVLGTRYVAVKTLPIGTEEDVFRFVANVDGTTIDISGDVTEQLVLDAGEFAEIRSTGALVAEGNEPFVAVHYLPSASVANPDDPMGGGPPIDSYDCGEVQLAGDPGMNVLFPVENWLGDYLFVQGVAGVGGGWCNDHATITAPLDQWSEITLSDEALPEPTPIGDSSFGFVRVPLPEDTYRLRAPAEVGVQLDVYGLRTTGSYIYPGGVRLEAINPEG